MKIYTEIQINATAEKIWSVLTDFEKYSEWNPFIKSLQGNVVVGGTISAHIQDMHFKPKVLTFRPNKGFSWLGSLWVKGLFDGLHSFELQQQEDGSTRFIQQEVFSGILVRLFAKSLNTKTKAGFIKMNEALKWRTEI